MIKDLCVTDDIGASKEQEEQTDPSRGTIAEAEDGKHQARVVKRELQKTAHYSPVLKKRGSSKAVLKPATHLAQNIQAKDASSRYKSPSRSALKSATLREPKTSQLASAKSTHLKLGPKDSLHQQTRSPKGRKENPKSTQKLSNRENSLTLGSQQVQSFNPMGLNSSSHQNKQPTSSSVSSSALGMHASQIVIKKELAAMRMAKQGAKLLTTQQ